jgi:hypothetical protein
MQQNDERCIHWAGGNSVQVNVSHFDCTVSCKVILRIIRVPVRTYPWPKTRPAQSCGTAGTGARGRDSAGRRVTPPIPATRGLVAAKAAGPRPTFPFIRQRRTFHCSAIGTFTSHEPTPVSRGTDVANPIPPSLSPASNWNRNTAKEAPNTENGVFGNHSPRARLELVEGFASFIFGRQPGIPLFVGFYRVPVVSTVNDTLTG